LLKLFRQTVPQCWPGGGKNSGHRTGCVIALHLLLIKDPLDISEAIFYKAGSAY